VSTSSSRCAFSHRLCAFAPVQELRLKTEAYEEVLSDADRKRSTEMRQLKETLWARDEEVRVHDFKFAGGCMLVCLHAFLCVYVCACICVCMSVFVHV